MKCPRLHAEICRANFLGPTETALTRCCSDDKERTAYGEDWGGYQEGFVQVDEDPNPTRGIGKL